METVHETLIRWFTADRTEEAFAEASRHHKPLFIDLYAPGCKGCEKLDKTTYLDRSVAQTLNESYVPLLINGREPIASLDRANGRHIYLFSPVLILTTPDGLELRRCVGYLSPLDMQLELAVGLAFLEMHRRDWNAAYQLLDRAITDFDGAANLPEALWWRGVAAYRRSGNDLNVLRRAWEPILVAHSGSIWAQKARVLDPECLC